MGRLHFSSAPKYQKAEPVPEVKTFQTWADEAFDPDSDDLSGLMMVYEAFLDKEGRPPLPDDADAISELTSESSSSAATEDEEYPTLRRVPRERLQTPSSPSFSPQVAEPASNEFDDFVRIEVPRSESDGRPLATHQPSSPLRQSIAPEIDELPEHPSSDTPEVVIQRGDDERLFNYYQSYERPHFLPRLGPELRVASSARRIPGHPRISRVEIQRVPLANPPVSDRAHVRPRSASVSDVRATGPRVPERWLSAVDGAIVSSRILAQR